MKQLLNSIVLLTIAVVLILNAAAHGQISARENLAITIDRLAALNDTGELDRLITEGERKAATSQLTGHEYLELGLLLAGKALFGTEHESGKSCWLKAIKYLEKALNSSPKLAEAHAILGHLYLCPYVEDKEPLRKSKMHFQKALELNPKQTVAKDGMQRIALRSARTHDKLTYIKKNLDDLSRVTRSGRKFSTLSVKIQDSLETCDLSVEIKVADVPGSAIADMFKIMKHMGGVLHIKKLPPTPPRTIHSLIRMTGEISGVIYTNINNLNLELDRVEIVLHGQEKAPTYMVFIPFETLKKHFKREATSKAFFGSMTFKED